MDWNSSTAKMVISTTVLVFVFFGCAKPKTSSCAESLHQISPNEWVWTISSDPGNSNLELLETAINCGANVNAPDTVDGIPLGWPPVTLAAFGKAGDPTRFGEDSVWNADALRIIQLLIDHGAKIDAVNSEGANALMLATIGGRVPVVKFLMDKGMDVNATSNLHTNALFGAVASGNVELVELLLAKGIDVNLVSKETRTPMDMALQISEDAAQAQMRNAPGADPTKVVQILKQHGAKTAAQLGQR